jgi:hypothetical protein
MQLSEAKEAWKLLAPECPYDTLDESMRLRRCRRVTPLEERGILVEVDAVWRTCSFDEDSGQRLAELWPLLDGTKTIAELKARSDGDGAATHELLQSLYEHGILINASGSPVPALVFHDHAASIGRMWLTLLAEEAGLHRALASERVTRRLLLGHLLDRYHYVAGAAGHISRAIANAPNERLELMLSEHLSEEYWHGIWLASGLKAAGLSEHEIRGSVPLPATLGAMNFLRCTASTNALGYFATLGVRESHAAESVDREQEAWREWVGRGILPEAVLAPSRDHEIVDMEHSHSSISAEAFVGLPALLEQQQREILTVLTNFARVSAESCAGVLRYYQDDAHPLAFIPSWD